MSTIIFFFFNDTATTEIYTLSLHDALPIWMREDVDRHLAREALEGVDEGVHVRRGGQAIGEAARERVNEAPVRELRSEEHTSELQSRQYLVCRLLLEKKKKTNNTHGAVYKR